MVTRTTTVCGMLTPSKCPTIGRLDCHYHGYEFLPAWHNIFHARIYYHCYLASWLRLFKLLRDILHLYLEKFGKTMTKLSTSKDQGRTKYTKNLRHPKTYECHTDGLLSLIHSLTHSSHLSNYSWGKIFPFPFYLSCPILFTRTEKMTGAGMERNPTASPRIPLGRRNFSS